MPVSPYYEAVLRLLKKIEETQADAMEKAAAAIFTSLAEEGVLHIFGSGHSHLIAEEGFHRAGGLVPVNAILEPFLTPLTSPAKSGRLERVSGIAEILLDYYDPHPGEVLLLISNSGINAVPVEMAQLAKEREITVIALTSLAHSTSVPSRHGGGRRLFEVADIVIDNGAAAGDGAVTYPGLPEKVGPTSVVAGTFILNRLVCRVVEMFLEKGRVPPVYLSANLPEGDEHNRTLEAKYRHRIKLL